MVKYNREGEEVVMNVLFHSELENMLRLLNFDLQIDRMVNAILQKNKGFYQVGKQLECLKCRTS